MVEARGQLGLDEEALAEAHVLSALGRDELQRDGPPQPRVERPIDDAHAAATDDRFDRVTRELVAGAQLFGSDGRCQSVSVGRRVREGNLPGGPGPRGAPLGSMLASIVSHDDASMTGVRLG